MVAAIAVRTRPLRRSAPSRWPPKPHRQSSREIAPGLVPAWLEIGDDKGLRVAADALGEQAMRSEPALARSYAVALDRAGDLDKAGSLAQQLLGLHGDDAELRAIVQRMNASMPDQDTRARDPFFTVRRAEAYLENGRIDLAIHGDPDVIWRAPQSENETGNGRRAAPRA